nr:E3 ubiquitin-protein ligase TRIM36 isoform X1 [Crassostrea gigas]
MLFHQGTKIQKNIQGYLNNKAMNTAQDVVRCDLCTDVVQHYCKSCHVNLCGNCRNKHNDKNTLTKHEIVPFTSQHLKQEYKVQKCEDHPKQEKDLYCQDCNVPICSRCLTGNHKRHGAVDLEEICKITRNSVTEDLKELYHFEREYSKIVKDMERMVISYKDHCDKENGSLKKLGQVWHKIIDNAIEKIENQLADMIKQDLQILQDNVEKIQSSYQRVKQCIERNEYILKEENSFQVLDYKSDVEELRLVPSRKEVSPPTLIFPDTRKETIIQQIVSLRSSFQSSLPDITITKTGDVSMVSTRVLVENPALISVMFTYSKKLKGIHCESDDKVWIYGDDEKIRQLDKSGSTLQCFNAVSGNSQKDIALSKDGHIAFSHKVNECIYLVKKNGFEKYVDMAGWIPYGLMFNSDGELMVCMRRNDYTESKVGFFTKGKLNQEFQFDETGKPLFSISRNNMYICENGNGDICVSDWNACAVISMKKSGEFRFRYAGNRSCSFKEFYPHGIATDSYCRILVVDRDNNCVHVTDRNGKFLRYITCGLEDPFVLSLDENENLWVGECDNNCIKIIKYLE